MCMKKFTLSFPQKVQTATWPQHQRKLHLTLNIAVPLVALAVLLFADPTFAQTTAASDEWVKPGVDTINRLRSGVVTAGAAAIGLGIMILGVWACLTFRMNWDKLGYVIFGGILIMAGPQMAAGLLELATS